MLIYIDIRPMIFNSKNNSNFLLVSLVKGQHYLLSNEQTK